MQYDDAFTMQQVDDCHVEIFNYVAGMVPFIQKVIADVSRLCYYYHQCCSLVSKFIFNNTTENNTFINNINVKNKNKRKIT